MSNIFCDGCKKEIPHGENWNCRCDCDYCKDCKDKCIIELDARKDSPFEFKQCINCTKLITINFLLKENQNIIKYLINYYLKEHMMNTIDETDQEGFKDAFFSVMH